MIFDLNAFNFYKQNPGIFNKLRIWNENPEYCVFESVFVLSWFVSYSDILLKEKVNSISKFLIISTGFKVRIQYHRDVQTKFPFRSIPFRIWFNSNKSKNEHWRLNWHFLISGWWKLGNMELLPWFVNTSWLTCFR